MAQFQKYGNLSVLLFGVLFDVALMPRGQGTAVDARFTRQSVQATADSAKQEKGNNDVESKSEGLRKATAEDRRRIAAERAFAQAEKMRAEWKEESLRRAMRKYEDARVSWRSISSRGEEAGALSKIGESTTTLASFRKRLIITNRRFC